MFGKEQQDVVTDEEVGDYIAELHQEGAQELNNFILGEDDEMARDSTNPSTRTQDKD